MYSIQRIRFACSSPIIQQKARVFLPVLDLSEIIKYAFIGREKGKVTISLDKMENHVTLTIQDNGIGLPDEFDMNKSTGFGLMIVSMLSQQLKGTYTIENHKGTRSILKFDI